jgi:hypothetical protein
MSHLQGGGMKWTDVQTVEIEAGGDLLSSYDKSGDT